MRISWSDEYRGFGSAGHELDLIERFSPLSRVQAGGRRSRRRVDTFCDWPMSDISAGPKAFGCR